MCRNIRTLFNFERDFLPDGSQFDHLFAPDEIFTIGELSAQALAVPGHTPACMAFPAWRLSAACGCKKPRKPWQSACVPSCNSPLKSDASYPPGRMRCGN